MDNPSNEFLLRIFGSIHFIVALMALYFEICVLIAVFKVTSKSEQFLLVFSQNVAEILTTSQLVWLSVEVIVQKTTGLPHKVESAILGASKYPEALHYILIAINRSHSIVFPLVQHEFWSKRNLLLFAASTWVLGWSIDYLITYGIPSDDLANFGHDILNVEFGRIDRTKFGADDILHANLILYLTIMGICIIVYAIGLSIFFRRVWTRNQSSHTSQPSDGNIRLRLFIICFTNFIPFSAMIFFNYVSPPRNIFGSFVKTLCNILSSVCSSILLFIFSSWVRKTMPWPFINRLRNSSPLPSVVPQLKKDIHVVNKVEPQVT